MKSSKKLFGSIALVALTGVLAFAGPAVAKEGASGHGKVRVDPPAPVSTACVDGPVADAWAGLTLSKWNATNTDTGETWTFRFDDKGGVTYTRNGSAQVVATYVQPLAIRDASGAVVLTSPGAELGATVPFVTPLSHCSMIWYTSSGPLLMVRT